MADENGANQVPAAAAVRIEHYVRFGVEAQFEQVLREMTDVARRQPGFLGTEVLRPEGPQTTDALWQVVVRFHSAQQLDEWRNSPQANAGRARLARLTVSSPSVERLHGIEPWFSLPEMGSRDSPPHWKMAVITLCVIYPLDFLMKLLLRPLAGSLHPALLSLVGIISMVSLLTWLVMPAVTKAMRSWLYPTGR